MRIMKKIGAVVMAAVVFAGVLVTGNAASYPTRDLQFLSYVDEKELVEVTVTDEQADEMLKVIQEVTKDSKTDYEKAKNILEWIGKNIYYESDPNVSISVNPYDVFTNKKAVCGGYSNLYKEMLALADIPAVVMLGYYQGMAHAWNAVYADGRWFYCDSIDASFFDGDMASFTYRYTTNQISDVAVEYEDVLVGYYYGAAVVGAKEGITEVVVPEDFYNMQIETVSYQLFKKDYGVTSVTVGPKVGQIGEEGKPIESKFLETIHVKDGNFRYASSDGVLFNNDLSCLYVYPYGRTADTYVIPKETEAFLDSKNIFINDYLMNLEVEEGNMYFSSYDGALYDKEQTELLFVPIARTEVEILEDAEISYTAFANADLDKLTIIGKIGSPAEEYAKANGITFVDADKKPVPTPTPTPTPTLDPNPEVTFDDVKKGDYYFLPVQWALKQEVTTGWKDNLFAPHMECSRAQFVTFLWRAEGKPEPLEQANPFKDIEEEDYYYDAVLWAVEKGITSGTTPTTFAPDEKCQRSQIVTFLWRMEGEPIVNGSNPFEDVAENSYYYNAVLWAVEEEITTGWTKTEFAPKMICTRAQSVTFLYRNRSK